jgi:arylsulfatase A-like enzyme
MPNVYKLWDRGVKFRNYKTAAIACSPARSTLVTGLYSQQSWLCCTLTQNPTSKATLTPTLKHEFPTYGKLLREAGFQTPFVGKWHCSILREDLPGHGLEAYGFEGLSYPDPIGYNLQGVVGEEPDYPNDQSIANTAVDWLQQNAASKVPWCLTVSFVNPHDKEFFWGGTEYTTYNNLFEEQSEYQPYMYYATPDNTSGAPPYGATAEGTEAAQPYADPLSYGYPALPSNWESYEDLLRSKPSQQVTAYAAQAAIWGGAQQLKDSQEFSIEAYPFIPGEESAAGNVGIAKAPFSYWQRSLDSYTQFMEQVDQHIGEVVAALPADVAENTVIIFTSDHGEYAGSHGFLSGKVGSGYKEIFDVPLIVHDPSGRFVAEPEVVRDGLVSSVDLLRLLVTIGHKGSQRWLKGEYEEIYGKRLDVLAMLQSAKAPGRPYALLAIDELAPGWLNFNHSPSHVLGIQFQAGKLVTYTNWNPETAEVQQSSLETELYDYDSLEGREEMRNLSLVPGADALLQPVLNLLFDQILPDELQAPLPGAMQAAQALAKDQYLMFKALVSRQQPPNSSDPSEPPNEEEEVRMIF